MEVGDWYNPIVIATLCLAALTGVLAYAAFRTIRNNNEREQRRIAEDNRLHQEERERDFKIRLVSDLMNWCIRESDWLHEFSVKNYDDLKPLLLNIARLLSNFNNISVVLDKSNDADLEIISVAFQKCLAQIGITHKHVRDAIEAKEEGIDITDSMKTKFSDSIEKIKASVSDLRSSILFYRLQLRL